MALDTSLDQSVELSDLSLIEIEDAGAFVAACEQSQARSAIHFFPRLYFYGRGQTHQLRWERHAGSILVYQLRRRPVGWRMSLYLPPMPFNDAALKIGLERTADYNGHRKGKIVWVPEGEALAITRAGLPIRFKADEFIFHRARVLARDGSEFRSLRKDLAGVGKLGTVETRPYRKDDLGVCVALVKSWRDRLRAAGSRVSSYSETLACLTNADRFDHHLLRGLVVEVDGVVRGFAFSGHLAGAMGCNFLGITDVDYRGLPQLLVYRLMAEFPRHETFNDSTDAGRPGLREAKNRFRPIRMLGLFTAREG